MNRNLLQKILIGLFFTACILIGVKQFNIVEFDTPQTTVNNKVELNSNVSSSRMTYGRFLEYLEMGWVKQVDLYDNSRNAIVQASSPELGNRPQTIRVEIPVGASQLIQKLKEYNIDFDEDCPRPAANDVPRLRREVHTQTHTHTRMPAQPQTTFAPAHAHTRACACSRRSHGTIL